MTPAAASDVFIVAYARTPIGVAFTGGLAEYTAAELGAHAIKGCLARVQRTGDAEDAAAVTVDEVIMGHVLSAGCGQAPAALAAALAGLPGTTPAWAVSKVCASGAKAVALGAGLVARGEAQCVLAGGMESMSRVPYACPLELRLPQRGLRHGHAQLTDLLLLDGLTGADGAHMGTCAEHVAELEDISRAAMDAYGARSRHRALHAAPLFAAHELLPLGAVQGDEGPLRPVRDPAALPTPFRPGGRITPATSSQLSDGAAALLLMGADALARCHVRPLARVLAWADAGVPDPRCFPLAPIDAIRCAARRAALPLAAIDLFEINEAFALVPLVVARALGIDPDAQVNVLGGAVALGHPLGCSGARIIATLLTALASTGKRIGCAAICNGGGGATALIIERIV